MRLSLSGLFRGRRTVERPAVRRETFFRPSLEMLEGRIVMSAPAVLPPPVFAPAVTQAPAAAATTLSPQQLITQAMNLNITGITTNQAGQLVATGTAFGYPFQTPLSLSTATNPNSAATCPILNLHLNAIHVDLLGLHVDTSPICLSLTALPGNGNLLGNLLCNVADLLNSGSTLGNILGGQTSVNPTDLISGLTGLLNGALGNVLATPSTTPPSSGTGGHHQPGATCPILDLSLGATTLDVLGLVVNLDNCTGGPVTVDVTAVPGPGHLLGNLLCNVAHLLDQPNPTSAISALLNNVLRDIQGLL